jgi:predicted DNA-binding protein (UPF0251 family)
MPRPRLCRRVWLQPNVTYFKPAGVRMIDLEESILAVDEFEAVRLKDLLGLEQEEAAKKMNISQPTFHRLVLSARKKIADAIVNGKAIKIEGGNFKIVKLPKIGRGRGFGGPAAVCICPTCGYQEPKTKGVSCISRKCIKCGSSMIRNR